MIFQEVCWPVHTSQECPAAEEVPVFPPNGCTPPRELSQIMISVPSGGPFVVGVELIHRSYATSYAPEPGCTVLQELTALPSLETWMGRPLLAVQLPQWQP